MLLPKSLPSLDSSSINLTHPGKRVKLPSWLSGSPFGLPPARPSAASVGAQCARHGSLLRHNFPGLLKSSRCGPPPTILLPSWLFSLTWSGLEGDLKFHMWYPKSNVILEAESDRCGAHSSLPLLTFLSFPVGFGKCFLKLSCACAITCRFWYRKFWGRVWDSAFLASS